MFDDPLVRIGLLVLLLVLSGFFSGSETALLAMDRLRVKYLAEKNRAGAKQLEALLRHPDRLLSGILIGNNLVNIAASVFATGLFVQLYGVQGEWLTILVLTPILLLFAEICPKSYAASNPERVSFVVLRPIGFVLYLFAPFIWLTSGFSRLLRNLLRSRDTAEVDLSEDEIRSIINVGEESGVVAAEQRRMLHGVFDLAETRVVDVMIPRTEVIGIEVSTPLVEVVQRVRSARHSRFPVYEGTLDTIVGIIHAKDILSADCLEGFDLRRRCRVPSFVPESKPIAALLQMFRRRRTHLAVVLDEYGGTAGVVTLEDVLEEIVGDIQDEYDQEGSRFRRVGERVYRADAGMSIRAVNRQFGLELSGEHVTTLAGFLLQQFGTIPAESETLEYQGVRFTVCRIVDRRIQEVEMAFPERVEPLESEPGDTR